MGENIDKSQREAVINHFEKYGSISALTAIEEYGILRLSAIILNLRKQGYNIRTDKIKYVNRYGNKGQCALYRLEE